MPSPDAILMKSRAS